jgi:hypothetical protein
MTHLAIVLMAATLPAAPEPAARILAYDADKSIVAVVTLDDQFERQHAATDHRGDVLVLVYGDRQGADANRTLGEQVHVHFHPTARGLAPAEARRAPVRPLPGLPEGRRSPDVVTVPVATIGPVPGVVQSIIRSQFRSGSPDAPVWLDFQDQMKKQFGLQARVPNMAVLDAAGRLRLLVTGRPTAEQLGRVLGAVEALRREAAAAP